MAGLVQVQADLMCDPSSILLQDAKRAASRLFFMWTMREKIN